MTRVDHVLVAVPDLAESVARWESAGLHPIAGGTHPGGTSNALLRGPERAYLELICAAPDGDASAARILESPGPISWALGVDDIDVVRARLAAWGYSPGPVRDGSRTTPRGDVLRWRLCDIVDRRLDPVVPFLIEWATEMPPGPADGLRLRELVIQTPTPDDAARVLTACGLAAGGEGSGRREMADGTVTVILLPGTEGIREVGVVVPHCHSRTVTLDGLVLRCAPTPT